MVASVSEQRIGLADALSDVEDLNPYAFWPDVLTERSGIVAPDLGHYHETMGSPGSTCVTYQIYLLIAPVQQGYEAGQMAVDPYLAVDGAWSVKAAIERDRTLGGRVQTLIVKRWHDYGSLDIGQGGIEWWGAKVEVEVYP